MQQYLKAIFAAFSAGLGSLATVLVGTTTTFSQVTDGQWVTVAVATLGAGAIVWGVPNAPAKVMQRIVPKSVEVAPPPPVIPPVVPPPGV